MILRVMMLRKKAVAVLIAIALLAGCASCSNTKASINRRPQSGSASASAVNGVQTVTLTVGDTFRFTPDVITVHPGQVQIILVHKGTGAPHDFEVLGFPATFVPLVRPGGTSMATFTAPAPGKYTFICTIHQAQGQIGTLIVTAD
jgi:plastocyanin